MNDITAQKKTEGLAIAASSDAEFTARIRALEELGMSGDKSLVPRLREILNRPEPLPVPGLKGWDPQGVERVVSLRIVAALHQLGDDSELGRLVPLVRRAGRILKGPYDELLNAVSVIRAIGRTEPVAGLVALAVEQDPAGVRNAVIVLDGLGLPDPPVRQSLAEVPKIPDSVSFTIHTLKEELESLASLSHGSIVLSPGVRGFLISGDYERGEVVRQDVSLREVVEHDLSFLGFDYFVEDGHAVICTYAEAGARWQAWWKRHGADLIYAKDQAAFVLRKRR